MGEVIKKIAAQAEELHFGEDLPSEIADFKFKKIFAEDGDKFIFFSYENTDKHKALTVYFHEETMEFKVRQKIGLNEFCITKYFTEDFGRFKAEIYAEIEFLVNNLSEERPSNQNRFLREKKIAEWAFGRELPQKLEGFDLFIRPSAAVEVTNASFIVVNYADFATNSDFIIYFNILRDDFSGESRINGVLKVTYTFDAKTLDELADKLKNNLVDELREIRRLEQ